MKYKEHKQYRLPGHDYSRDGYYFVTICTKDRKHFFGNVTGGEMYLSPIGWIAYECWLEIPQRFLGVYLDEFVVMPNHTHVIVIIDRGGDVVRRNNHARRNTPRRVPTEGLPFRSGIGPLIEGSLSSIINHY